MPKPGRVRHTERSGRSLPQSGRPPSQVRIIGGRWRRTLLAVADRPGLRPTPDRVRETVFNWLGQDLTGCSCLDLYAGSGALGFEAASRGATRVVMVERDLALVQILRATAERLDAHAIEIVSGDALTRLASLHETFDLVLLDPPFASAELARIAPALARVLAPAGRLYVEWHTPLAADSPLWQALPDYELYRAGRAGQVHYHVLQRRPPDTASTDSSEL